MSSQTLSPDDAINRREVTWRGAFALFAQRMGQDARSWKFHLTLALSIFALFIQASFSAENFGALGAPGLAYLSTWGKVSFFLIFIGGVSYFVRIISEEKEQGTLALLKLTGIGSFGILSGLFGSRLVQVLVVFALQLPFILWSVTLGGVTLHQVLAMFLTLLATLFLVGSVALFSAVVTRGPVTANGFCYFLLLTPLFAYGGLKWASFSIEQEILDFSGSSQVRWLCVQGMAFLSAVSPYRRLVAIMSTGYAEPLINLQVVFSLAAGGLLFAVSVALFDWFSRQNDLAPWDSESHWNIFRWTKAERKSERCWNNPYVWREFQFRKQGGRGLILSLLGAFGMSWFFFSGLRLILLPLGYREVDFIEFGISVGIIWLWSASLACCLIAPWAIGSILVRELRAQTFGTLFLVARRPEEILFGLIVGRGLLLLHLIFWLLAGIFGCITWRPETFGLISGHNRTLTCSFPAIILVVAAYVISTDFFGMIGIRLSLNRVPLRKQLVWVIGSLIVCCPCGGHIFLMLISPILVASIVIFEREDRDTTIFVISMLILYALLAIPISVKCWKDSIEMVRDRMSDD